MAQLRNIIVPALNGAALVVALAAVTIWSARLEHRVSGLEARVQALATAPTNGSEPARAGAAIEQACANLAIRAADVIRTPGKDQAGQSASLQELMRQLGCASAKPQK